MLKIILLLKLVQRGVALGIICSKHVKCCRIFLHHTEKIHVDIIEAGKILEILLGISLDSFILS